MKLNELIEEAEVLARPCYLLSDRSNDSDVVGYWGGSRSDIPRTFPAVVTEFLSRRHLISITETLFSQLQLDDLFDFGLVGLFEWKSRTGDICYRIEYKAGKRFTELEFTGTPLYAISQMSYPPFEAICLYGSERIGAWLMEQSLKRYEYWRVADGIRIEYEDEWIRRTAFHNPTDDMVAIVGGWPMIWPDDDFYAPPELRLLFLTLREAEPWLEVWHCPMSRSLFVRERIT